MDYTKYQNCLRMQIVPDDTADERIECLVNHCKKYGFNNVTLMFNAESFCVGHITLEELKPWVETMKKAADKLRANNITISLNNWLTYGHVDRGRVLKEGQNFTTMQDRFGSKTSTITCPLCENWQKYFDEIVYYTVKELEPEIYWIEDDFRFNNHGGIKDACFCELHMAEYNKRLGANYTAKQFGEKIFEKGYCNKERRVWLDVRRENSLNMAKRISLNIKKACPKTEIGLMSSGPATHCSEGRNWDELFENLSVDGNKIHRIHLPYVTDYGKDYYYEFNKISMVIRAMAEDDVKILPEIEMGAASPYYQDSRFLKFKLESASPLLLNGMTYSIYDFIGNGPIDEYGYGKVVKDTTTFMQGVLNLGFKFSSINGVIVPIDTEASYKIKIKSDESDIISMNYHAGSYLSAMGISYKYSKEKVFKENVIVLFGNSVQMFTKEQLIALFNDNFVIVDGSAALELKELDLLYLIGASDIISKGSENGYHTYEELSEGKTIYGKRRFRASGRADAGNFTELTYTDGSVKHLSYVYNEYGEKLAPAFTTGKNFAIIPYIINSKIKAQFSELRKTLLIETIKQHANNIVITDYSGKSAYLYTEKDRNLIIMVNSSLESFKHIEFYIKGVDFTEIYMVGSDGSLTNCKYERTTNGNIIINIPFEYLSTKAFLLK